MMLIKTPKGKLLVDNRQKAVKGYCIGRVGFLAQIKVLKEVVKDGAR